MLLLVSHMIRSLPKSYFAAESITPLIQSLLHGFSNLTPTYQLLVRIAEFFVLNFQAKSALKFLIEAIDKGSELASEIVIRSQLPYSFVFPQLSRAINPGKSGPLISAI